MRIEEISAQYIQQAKLKKSNRTAKRADKAKDQYIPSSTNPRSMALASIKAKMKAGFYNSEKVADDITEKLAKYFDQE